MAGQVRDGCPNVNTLRPARESEARAIVDLIHRTGINPFGLEWRRFVVIVDDRGRLLACGQIKLHGDGSRELASIAVQPDARGRGLARQVIEHLICGQPAPLYLTCRDELQPFYEKFGFRVLVRSEMPPYFRRLSRLVDTFRSLFQIRRRMLVMRRG